MSTLLESNHVDIGYIYIARDIQEPGYLKVGKTKNLKKRLKQYNAHRSKQEVAILAASSMQMGITDLEVEVLKNLSKYYTKRKSEWFAIANTNVEVFIQRVSHVIAYYTFVPYIQVGSLRFGRPYSAKELALLEQIKALNKHVESTKE